MRHYHIRWDDGNLDWEPFQTEDEAKAAATELVRSGESYIIEQSDRDCLRCARLQSESLSPPFSC